MTGLPVAMAGIACTGGINFARPAVIKKDRLCFTRKQRGPVCISQSQSINYPSYRVKTQTKTQTKTKNQLVMPTLSL